VLCTLWFAAARCGEEIGETDSFRSVGDSGNFFDATDTASAGEIVIVEAVLEAAVGMVGEPVPSGVDRSGPPTAVS